jgi:hypothetical protein
MRKKVHILCDSTEYPGAAEYVMHESTERYDCQFRGRNKFCHHLWTFYAYPPSFICTVRVNTARGE